MFFKKKLSVVSIVRSLHSFPEAPHPVLGSSLVFVPQGGVQPPGVVCVCLNRHGTCTLVYTHTHVHSWVCVCAFSHTLKSATG